MKPLPPSPTQKKLLFEHLLVLAFTVFTSSMLVVSNSPGPLIALQAMVLLAAGNAAFLVLLRRRIRALRIQLLFTTAPQVSRNRPANVKPITEAIRPSCLA